MMAAAAVASVRSVGNGLSDLNVANVRSVRSVDRVLNAPSVLNVRNVQNGPSMRRPLRWRAARTSTRTMRTSRSTTRWRLRRATAKRLGSRCLRLRVAWLRRKAAIVLLERSAGGVAVDAAVDRVELRVAVLAVVSRRAGIARLPFG
jgi:hypothetical protein